MAPAQANSGSFRRPDMYALAKEHVLPVLMSAPASYRRREHTTSLKIRGTFAGSSLLLFLCCFLLFGPHYKYYIYIYSI